MTKKGAITEIFSMALYHDNPDRYFIGYLDLGTVKETTLREFLKISENFEIIPVTRILYIKKDSEILYSKSIKRKYNDTARIV